MPTVETTEFNYKNFASGSIYPLGNPIDQGYGVTRPNSNPANNNPNGRMLNQRGQKIDFYIEEISADFGMTGTTGQSRKVRQFFPHNIVQPSVTVTGTAPDSHQYNRLAAFVRVSHRFALSGRSLMRSGIPVRSYSFNGAEIFIPTVRFVIRNGHLAAGNFPYNGRNVKGVHRPWVLEGYIKSMPAGGEHFNHAPQFQFEFLVSESLYDGNIGVWSDTRIGGSQLRSWMEVFKNRGKNSFVTDNNTQSPDVKGSNTNDSSNDSFDFSQGPFGTGPFG